MEVPGIALDTLISEYGVPDLLKIDVEAAEYTVLQSLTQKVPTLCFEFAHEFPEDAFKCIDYCISLGFTEFYLQHGDKYIFRPTSYNLTPETLKHIFINDPNVDWGMIWAR